MLFRFVAVRLVIGFGPLATGKRLTGKLVEGLPGEVLTGPAHADQVDLAAADVHGGDAAIAFHIESALVAFPARADGCDEPGHGSGACPWKRGEDGGVGMVGDEFVAKWPMESDVDPYIAPAIYTDLCVTYRERAIKAYKVRR